MTWRGSRVLALAAVLLCTAASGLVAQESQSTVFPTTAGAEAARLRATVLSKKITVRLEHVTLEEALTAIADQARIRLVYSRYQVPLTKQVSLVVDTITVGDALTVLLRGTGVAALVSPSGWIALDRTRSPDATDVGQAGWQTTGVVSGRVADARTGAPVANATVRVDGTRLEAVTTPDGRYRIPGLSAGAYRLTVRRLGYTVASQDVTVAADQVSSLDFALSPAAQLLDQVVTTVTGDMQRKGIGSNIGTISVDSIVGREPVTNLADVLSGRVSGVQVFSYGGLSGASPATNIRGQGSYNLSNQPLMYIDGARVDNTTASDALAGFAESSGRFNDLVPDEIESIEVVRGPSAATLYGTDAANGVILVRTKRGASGRARWNVYAERGVLSVDRNRFKKSYYPWGHAPGTSGPDAQCVLQQVAASTCVQDSVTQFTPLRDALLTPIGTGNREAYGIQVSGGDRVRYFLSGAIDDETGYLKMPHLDEATVRAEQGAQGVPDEVLHPNAYRKYSIRDNMSTPVGPRADASLSVGYLSDDSRIPSSGSLLGGQLGPGYRDSNDGWLGGQRASAFYVTRHDESTTHFTGSATFNWLPFGWLSGHATAGSDHSGSAFSTLAPYGESIFTPAGFRGNSQTSTTLYTIDLGATASAPVTSDLLSRTSIGAQYNRHRALTTLAQVFQLIPGCQSVNCGATPIVSEAVDVSVIVGAYAEEILAWRDRVFLTGGLRVDGGTNFGSALHSTMYPKASLSWMVSQERFWPSVPGLSSLRLRVAYGETGTEPQNTAALSTAATFPVTVDGQPGIGGYIGALANPHLKPERQAELESGFDAQLFGDRAHLEFTYYDKRSRDALFAAFLPPSYGVGEAEQNVGAVRNWGYEALLGAQLIDSRAIGWRVDLNGSVNHNQLVRLGPGVTANYGSFGVGALVPGYPVFAIFDVPFTYADANSDHIIESSEVTASTHPALVGSAYPPTQVTGSASLLFSGHLHLLAQFDYRGGFKLADHNEAYRCFFGYCNATSLPSTSLVDQARAANFINSQGSAFWGFYDDGSFVRFRELSLTYDVPTRWARGVRASSISVTLGARNIALWTKYTGVDPEVNSVVGAAGYGAYFDQGSTPPAAYWIARVNLGI